MPKLVRLYIKHTIIGFVLSAIFVSMLLGLNVANLWHLVSGSSAGMLAAFLLFMFNGIVFSGVQFGIAIMRMADTSDDDRSGGRRRPQPVLNPMAKRAMNPALVPVPVSAETRPRRRG